MVESWTKLGHTTLTTAGDTITVSGMTAKKFLMVQVFTIASGNTYHNVRFNNDSDNNYSNRYNDNGGSEATQSNASSILLGGDNNNDYMTSYIINKSDKEKLAITHSINSNTAGAGTAPTRREIVGKWTNTTDQITRIDVINGNTGDFASGSELIVWGTD